MKTINGKGGMKATLLADSISPAGIRIRSYEVEFHRYILAEYNTHRVFSRNAASSRAIPIMAQLAQISDNPAMPFYYGMNQAGMSAKLELPQESKEAAEAIILMMRDYCLERTKELHALGLHKQHANRYIEPWQWVKGVVTSTEWENFFYLRDHPDAQPEIQELASIMQKAGRLSTPKLLQPGQYHLPYIGSTTDANGLMSYICGGEGVSLENAIKLSASLCAQSSYRKSDESLDKALDIYQKLVGMKPVHASPFEHQATPMVVSNVGVTLGNNPNTPEPGVTHVDSKLNVWSGNLRGWVQNRQLIEGNAVYG